MTGIQVRHTRSCRSAGGGGCSCKPSYRAWVWDKRSKQRIFKTFRNQAEAKSWRGDAEDKLRKGTMKAPTKTTLREAAEAWLDGAEEGVILTRKREPYKPSVIRSYRQGLRDHVLPELGALRLSEIQRTDLQDSLIVLPLRGSILPRCATRLRLCVVSTVERFSVERLPSIRPAG